MYNQGKTSQHIQYFYYSFLKIQVKEVIEDKLITLKNCPVRLQQGIKHSNSHWPRPLLNNLLLPGLPPQMVDWWISPPDLKEQSHLEVLLSPVWLVYGAAVTNRAGCLVTAGRFSWMQSYCSSALQQGRSPGSAATAALSLFMYSNRLGMRDKQVVGIRPVHCAPPCGDRGRR